MENTWHFSEALIEPLRDYLLKGCYHSSSWSTPLNGRRVLSVCHWAVIFMLRSVLTIAFVVSMVLGCLGQDGRPVGESLRPMLEVLDRAQLTGSLQFSGRCVEGYIPDLPQFRVPAE